MSVISTILSIITTILLGYVIYKLYKYQTSEKNQPGYRPGPAPGPGQGPEPGPAPPGYLNSYSINPPKDCNGIVSLPNPNISPIKKYKRINNSVPIIPPEFRYAQVSIPSIVSLSNEPIPSKFSLRDTGLLLQPYDQGICGTCWAHATTTALADKFSIKTRQPAPKLSVLWTITNTPYYYLNDPNHYVCPNGGVAAYAIKLLMEKGCRLSSCWPYMELLKETSDGKSYLFPQALGTLDNKCCYDCCSKPSNPTYFAKNNSLRFPNSNDTPENITAYIQRELMSSGPVVACMYVSKDFQEFWNTASPGSIYMMKTNQPDGWHSVEIVGWGTTTNDPPIRYWEVKNSWGISGPDEDGYFKIRFSLDTPQEQRVFIDVPNEQGYGGVLTFDCGDKVDE